MFQSLLPRRPTPSTKPNPTRAPKRELEAVLADKRSDKALILLAQLETLEPLAARWPHKRGDVLRALGRGQEAFLAYAQAVRLYVDLGQTDRATAMARTAIAAVSDANRLIAQLDPATASIFDAVSGSAALALPCVL
jgi:hypothetical protein